MDEVYGYIERITFQNPENGYTIAQLKAPKHSDLITLVGSMPSLQPGETIRCKGSWKNHLVHGRQFIVANYSVEAPADLVGIKKYLGSGLIKGIGPGYAARIVAKFDIDTLNIIDQHPQRLEEVSGLGQKRIEKIKTCWQEQKSIREVMIFLQKYGVSPAFAQKIFKRYGEQSIKKVQENPFNLARDIFGIGFKIADTIANKLGIAHDSPQRINSGIEYVLSELSNDGHVCYPKEEYLEEAEKVLEVDKALIHSQLTTLKNDNRIELFDLPITGQMQPFIWIKSLFIAEIGIARELKRIHNAASYFRQVDVSKAIDWVQSQLKIELAKNQQAAVAKAVSEKLHIITGGPGTGKSTITKAILTITDKLTKKICLTAPTGRAAKRMTEITGKKAVTIHSLLEYDFKVGGFKRNRESPLDCELLIVDEASMIDTLLMYSLLKAVPDYCRLIFVGDINQLPSVGPGNVLKDIISSQSIPVTVLTEIFRQAAGSRIITNAHLINQGIFPDIRNVIESDFFFMESLTPEDVMKNILNLVTQRLPKKYGFNASQDIQILSPMKKGIVGTENLNILLQEALNSNTTSIQRGGRKFTVGDKVMQIRNDYKREVFNGDIGFISGVDLVDQEVIVNIDGRDVIYDFDDLDELVHAYAVSVHKFQGSECPCVVMPIHTTHFKLLFRNLLYTGVTRGKRLVVLVGTKQALALAVKNDEVKKRHTGLKQALIGTF